MKPSTSVVIWLSELALLCLVYSLLCITMPDIYLYDIYTDKFGFLTEAQWYDRYIFTLSVLPIILTTFLIWLFARYLYKKKTQ